MVVLDTCDEEVFFGCWGVPPDARSGSKSATKPHLSPSCYFPLMKSVCPFYHLVNPHVTLDIGEHGEERNMSPSAAVWLIDVFLIVSGQQQRSTAQRNMIYWALDTRTIL